MSNMYPEMENPALASRVPNADLGGGSICFGNHLSDSQTSSVLSFAELQQLTGNRLGAHDVPCPICGPDRRSAINQRRKVLRVWQITPSFATFHCARCDLNGHAREDGAPALHRAALAIARTEAAQLAAAATEKKRERARWLWRQRQPIPGTVAETYLRECRRYKGPLPPTLGFMPARDNFAPAMISAFGIPAELEPGILSISPAAVMAVHLTHLKADGSGKAGTDADKIMLGTARGAPIVVAAFDDMAGLAITEGIEDALSVHEATGLCAWAAGAASMMPALATVVPAWVECVTILVDDDDAGREQSEKLAFSLEARGVEARLVFPCASAAVKT
jgi:hypothetical protein